MGAVRTVAVPAKTGPEWVLPLQDKRVLVTGGARGIGRELALHMAAAGAQVTVTARSTAAAQETVAAIEELGGVAHAAELDLTSRASIAPALAAAITTMGGIDVLVCNSGVGGASAPLWELTEQEWDEVFDVNVAGAFICAKTVIPHLIAAGAGAVLFVGSMTGKRPLLHRSPYAASKMAVLGLCRTLALDLGPHGVRANVISPGLVGGERLEWVIDKQAAARGLDRDTVRSEMLRDTPLNRFTTAGDVAATAVFLASDAAVGITGEDINVSSGLVMY
jgi:NAD(P)-dependent dehydrogenase (short-subunit alcohol dehydrogenase family)